MNKSEEELEKERLKNLILFKMYLTDEEFENSGPLRAKIIVAVLIVFLILAWIF